MSDVVEADLARPDGDDDRDDEILEGEPVSARGAQAVISMVREEIRMHQGPLPDAETLEAYKRIDPRFPDAILDAFQEQSRHRRQMEAKLLEGSEKRANRGQFLGTALLVLGIAGGIWVTLAGQPVAGGILFGASLAVGALSYVFGDFRPSKEK